MMLRRRRRTFVSERVMGREEAYHHRHRRRCRYHYHHSDADKTNRNSGNCNWMSLFLLNIQSEWKGRWRVQDSIQVTTVMILGLNINSCNVCCFGYIAGLFRLPGTKIWKDQQYKTSESERRSIGNKIIKEKTLKLAGNNLAFQRSEGNQLTKWYR